MDSSVITIKKETLQFEVLPILPVGNCSKDQKTSVQCCRIFSSYFWKGIAANLYAIFPFLISGISSPNEADDELELGIKS